MKKSRFKLIIFVIFLISTLTFIIAEKIDIEIKNNYYPGEEINFKIILYDNNNSLLNEKIKFQIQNFYAETFQEGEMNSGEFTNYVLPNNARSGYWVIIATYKDIEKKQFFTVMELEKAEIKLDDEKLIITNVGNIPYRKSIQISIGEHEETALVPLGVGETKEIKLTAPNGKYDIKVTDGTEENTLTFEGVLLTGNVIGLEKQGGGLIQKYPIPTLFFIIIILAIIVISVLRIKNK